MTALENRRIPLADWKCGGFLFSKSGFKTILGTDQRSHNPKRGVGENFSIDECPSSLVNLEKL